jgi:hypothetical protein
MHMHTLDQLLSRVVERRGFAVQGTDAEALFAKKGDESLLAAWKTDAPLTLADAQLFVSAMEQVHATSGILVAPKGADQAAKDLASTKGVDVWAESRLVLEVGEALVHDALLPPAPTPAIGPAGPAHYPATPASPSPQPSPSPSASKHPSLVMQAAGAAASHSGAAYFMPNKPKAQPIDMQATIGVQKGGSLGYAWGGSTGGPTNRGIASYQDPHATRKVDQWGNAIDPSKASPTLHPGFSGTAAVSDDVEITAAPKKGRASGASAAAVVPAAPLPGGPAAQEEAYEIISTPKKGPAPAAVAQAAPACNTLKLNVSKEDALAKTSAKPGAIVKLALVPHVAFEYDLHLERPGIAPVAARGAILVSSLTGDLKTVDGALAWADAEPRDARKDQEKLTAVDVYEKVKGHMLKTYSKTMNVERELAGNTVMETVKIVPDPDEMGLQHRGVVYVPVWEITGGGVNAKVDAFSGTTA